VTPARLRIVVLLAALAAAGCSTQKPAPIADPNIAPTNYRAQIATFLSTVLIDRADFTNAQIAAPALEQVGSGQHYIVCVLFNSRSEHREKVVIYLAGNINQVVDAQAGQCASAAYQPFTELAAQVPRR
jgi:hypothetical protein